MKMRGPNSAGVADNNADGSYARYGSYQKGGSAYTPPVQGRTFAEQQTNVLADTVTTQYDTEGTAANVLNQMHTQRQQLQGARNDVFGMQEATAEAKKELAEMQVRNRKRKHRLYVTIAVLSVVDLLLLLRIMQCHGTFFFC